MLQIMLLAIGAIVCILIAKLNKSNKLFWACFLSMLAGFVGRAATSNAHVVNETKKCIIKHDLGNNPMLTSTCSLQAAPVFEEGEDTLVETKSTGKDYQIISFNTADGHVSPKAIMSRDQPFVYDTS